MYRMWEHIYLFGNVTKSPVGLMCGYRSQQHQANLGTTCSRSSTVRTKLSPSSANVTHWLHNFPPPPPSGRLYYYQATLRRSV